MKRTGSAQRLIDTIAKYTDHIEEIRQRLEALAEAEPLTGQHVAHAMRNIGKPPGEEVEIGSPTQPLPPLQYSGPGR